MKAGFDLSGQRILVTGAAGGIGKATARVCAALGATVLLGRPAPDRPPGAAAARRRRRGTGTVLDVNGGLYMN